MDHTDKTKPVPLKEGSGETGTIPVVTLVYP
jgi:hypothetical protein